MSQNAIEARRPSARETPGEGLILFVKAPRPGLVKTRLAETMGDESACAVYRRLIGIVLHQIAPFRAVTLCFTPADAREEVRPWLRPGWQAQPQSDGDLGQRMHAAFVEAFDARFSRVVIVGSDCPGITEQDIRQAWTSLKEFDVVVGPATDGGYWLIGLKAPHPSLFENVQWSSETVLAETLQRAKTAGLRVQLLRLLADIDTEAAWRQWERNSAPLH